jgi:uncharacterized membrane protein
LKPIHYHDTIKILKAFKSESWMADDQKTVTHVVHTSSVFLIASAVAIGFFLARCLITRKLGLLYLPWNLFLAWIPFALAIFAAGWIEFKARPRWVFLPAVLAWLLFLPNAPYLCTDLMHLFPARALTPTLMWFDLLLNLQFALTGLLLGFASLAVMQGLCCRWGGKIAGWMLTICALALSGFGVYLGRFLRFNSWDVLFSPIRLLHSIGERVWAPVQYREGWMFAFCCFLFLLISYLMCYHLMHLNKSWSTTPSVRNRS